MYLGGVDTLGGRLCAALCGPFSGVTSGGVFWVESVWAVGGFSGVVLGGRHLGRLWVHLGRVSAVASGGGPSGVVLGLGYTFGGVKSRITSEKRRFSACSSASWAVFYHIMQDIYNIWKDFAPSGHANIYSSHYGPIFGLVSDFGYGRIVYPLHTKTPLKVPFFR